MKRKYFLCLPVLFLPILWLLSVQMTRLFLFAVLIGVGSVWCWYTKKKKPILLTGAVVVLLAAVSTVFRTELDTARFAVLSNAYQSAAEHCCTEMLPEGDVRYDKYKGNFFLSNLGSLEVQKTGAYSSVYFPVSESFFHSRGYLYVNDERAYQTNHTFSWDAMDNVIPLSDHWVYVKLY